jgi:pyruvate formate lyase activating enzyme
MSKEKAIEMMAARRGFVDGVVITGGEPTISPELYEIVVAIKALNLAVKLDTNGYNPDVLRALFASRVLDFVAMDIKTYWPKYSQATGIAVDTDRLMESVALIKSSGVNHEFRTTCVPPLVDGEDIEAISRLVGKTGQYTLQQFQPENTLNPKYESVIPYSLEILTDFLEIARRNTASCRLIGLGGSNIHVKGDGDGL